MDARRARPGKVTGPGGGADFRARLAKCGLPARAALWFHDAMHGAHPILSCEEAREFEAAILGGDEAREWEAMQAAGRAAAVGRRWP